MEKRKLVITLNIEEQYLQQIKKVIPDWEIFAGRDEEVWVDHLKDAEIVANWRKAVADNCLQDGAKLKWIQTWSAGVNSLPLQELNAKGIALTSANGVHAYPISETIFALMLSLTRKIHTYIRNQQAKKWDEANIHLELHQKTIGIIGVGAIGREVAKIAKAFGMKVLGVRNSGKPAEFVDQMYTKGQLNDILPECDYVVVTLPLTEETEHLFGKKQFALMKQAAFFINIGRGPIVVEQELIEALQEKRIAGAGLDVFETEPLPESSPLWEMENVIITPHTSGLTEHYDQRVIEDIFIPNLKTYLDGGTPDINHVDYKKGY